MKNVVKALIWTKIKIAKHMKNVFHVLLTVTNIFFCESYNSWYGAAYKGQCLWPYDVNNYLKVDPTYYSWCSECTEDVNYHRIKECY